VTDLSRPLDRPVVLVGLMGVGKSTVGRRLARGSGLPFVDSDAEIEGAAGFPAAEVFERYGELDFRDGERRLVARLIEGDVRVIATGGGAYVDPSTRKLLNERAITVWLDAPVDILAERTSRRNTRAQLRNGDPKLVLERLIAGTAALLCRGAHPCQKRRRSAQGRGRRDRCCAGKLLGNRHRRLKLQIRLLFRQSPIRSKRPLLSRANVAGLGLPLEPLAIP
jgi:Shikimate kinase